MQHLDDGQWDEEGCFVYQVVNSGGLGIHSELSVGKEFRTNAEGFKFGDLVSIDLVQPSRIPGSKNGPFLRLSDRSGWMFERKYGKVVMQRIPVQTGLWCFYVDNHTIGQALRSHPVDRFETAIMRGESFVAYDPLQKIYCDRQVIHPATGVNFYRVQGTQGWVFDRRIDANTNEDIHMLLDESKVKAGIFAYESLFKLGIRSKPEVGEGTKTGRTVVRGELVVADFIRQSPIRDGNGPFLRLTDGSGWLFTHKHDDELMEEIPIEKGLWIHCVLNAPAGIAPRSQPIDDYNKSEINQIKYKVEYKPGSTVESDLKITDSAGVNFFRVKGTDGWIFDSRDGDMMLELVSSSTVSPPRDSSKPEWGVDFIRGVAFTVGGWKEGSLNDENKAILFHNQDGVHINVYYQTRTIGIALNHQTKGNRQLFIKDCDDKELADILKNPKEHTGKAYKYHKDEISSNSQSHGHSVEGEVFLDREEELRHKLLLIQEQRHKLFTKELECLRLIKKYDDKQKKLADERNMAIVSKRKELAKIRAREEEEMRLEETLRIQQEEQIREQEKAMRLSDEESLIRARGEVAFQCGECRCTFQNAYDLDQHCRDHHGLICEYCDRIFSSFQSLEQHKESSGHY